MSKRGAAKQKAVILAKLIAKNRDNWTCIKCGRSKEEGWTMHGAHIMPVEWDGTAADPENIICLCATCHSMGRKSAHEDPIEFARWYDETFPGKYDKLREQAYEYSRTKFPKIDWKEVHKDLLTRSKSL